MFNANGNTFDECTRDDAPRILRERIKFYLSVGRYCWHDVLEICACKRRIANLTYKVSRRIERKAKRSSSEKKLKKQKHNYIRHWLPRMKCREPRSSFISLRFLFRFSFSTLRSVQLYFLFLFFTRTHSMRCNRIHDTQLTNLLLRSPFELRCAQLLYKLKHTIVFGIWMHGIVRHRTPNHTKSYREFHISCNHMRHGFAVRALCLYVVPA